MTKSRRILLSSGMSKIVSSQKVEMARLVRTQVTHNSFLVPRIDKSSGFESNKFSFRYFPASQMSCFHMLECVCVCDLCADGLKELPLHICFEVLV